MESQICSLQEYFKKSTDFSFCNTILGQYTHVNIEIENSSKIATSFFFKIAMIFAYLLNITL